MLNDENAGIAGSAGHQPGKINIDKAALTPAGIATRQRGLIKKNAGLVPGAPGLRQRGLITKDAGLAPGAPGIPGFIVQHVSNIHQRRCCEYESAPSSVHVIVCGKGRLMRRAYGGE